MDIRLDAIDIRSDGALLGATLLSPPRRMPGILFVHGWGGTQKHDLVRARQVAALGCICLTFDLRGHERTLELRETVSREQNLHDLLSAYDQLASRDDVDPGAIGVIGISYGGYLASIASSMRRVRWLALRSPALYMDEDWKAPKQSLNADPALRAYRRRIVEPASNRALRACLDFHGDALLIEAGNDDIVPHEVTANYRAALANAASLTTRTIADADHGLSDKPSQQAYTQLLVGWFTEMVMTARTEAAKAIMRANPTP